jgi:hypothetical protein
MLLVVKQGIVNHDGIEYTRGQALPEDISSKEARRLIDLDACVEGVAAMIAATVPAVAPPVPIVDGIPGGPVGEPIKIDFNPDEAIKGARR